MAIQEQIADLRAVAEECVIAKAVVWRVDDLVEDLVTAIDGARDSIADQGCRAGLTVEDRIAGLRPIAEETVIADGVVRRVCDDVKDLIAGVGRTSDSVINRRGRTYLTAEHQITKLGAVAE